MRKLAATLVAIAALVVAATPAHAVTRQIASNCYAGKVNTNRFNPVVGFLTDVGCPSWTFYQNGKFVTWTRPLVDLEGATRSAKHFWPNCSREWSGVVDDRPNTGIYYTFFSINC